MKIIQYINSFFFSIEQLAEEYDRYRTNAIARFDECDIKRRENEQLLNKIHELESVIKSLRDASDLQKQLNFENEVNKLELKRKQDDFEQFQRVSFIKNKYTIIS